MQFPTEQSRTRRFIISAVLCGIALALSLVDGAISSLIPILPGFKLGLANIVSLFALYYLGIGQALLICLVRSLLQAIFSGNMTMLLFSLLGGVASIAFMYLLIRRISIIKVSVVGAIVHNTMQILVAMFLTNTQQVLYYLPVLIIAGALSGFLMGALCKLVLLRVFPKVVL